MLKGLSCLIMPQTHDTQLLMLRQHGIKWKFYVCYNGPKSCKVTPYKLSRMTGGNNKLGGVSVCNK